MKTLVYLSFTFLFAFLAPLNSSLFAQSGAFEPKYALPQLLGSTSSIAPFHVSYVRLDLDIDPTQHYLIGAVQSHLKIEKTTNSIRFDLNRIYQVDSIWVNSAKFTDFAHVRDSLVLHFPSALNPAEHIIVDVFYQGFPPQSPSESFRFTSRAGEPHIWTLSEPYGARDWWPVYDHPAHKADSADIIIHVPAQLTAVSNGVLIKNELIGSKRTFEWKHRYPISPYLISVTVASYRLIEKFYTDPVGNSYPIQHFVYSDYNPSGLTKQLNYTETCLDNFTNLFGEYPFKNEKYGHAMFNWGGGMEHQTISSMVNFSGELIAHELAHQWFGDAITCATWQDIWLNEGFASYAEGLMEESDQGANRFKSWRSQQITTIIAVPTGSVYVPDSEFKTFNGLGSVDRIFSFRLTYTKGSMVLHQLRYLLSDEPFFRGLKAYMNSNLRYKSATTLDFKTVLENELQVDLADYFQNWVFSEGFPVYTFLARTKVGETSTFPFELELTLNQRNSAGKNLFYDMPLEFSLSTGTRDTLIRITPEIGKTNYSIGLTFEPEFILLDPNSNVIHQTENSTFSIPPVLGSSTKHEVSTVFPNPFSKQAKLQIKLISPQMAGFRVFDTLGRLVFTESPRMFVKGESELIWDKASKLADGVYVIEVEIDSEKWIRKVVLVK